MAEAEEPEEEPMASSRIRRTDGADLDDPIEHAGDSAAATMTRAAPTRKGQRYNDYFGGTPDAEPDMPQPGDRVWYHHRYDGEWIQAVVVDAQTEGFDEPMFPRAVHIAVDLTRQYRMETGPGSELPVSASRLGFRLNVREGLDLGEWQSEKPDGADAQYQREQAAKLARTEINREMAMDGGLTATHRGRLPNGVKK